jgi:formate hydrogenlyase subunit 6/NADH:ubiquinone oxidoreductase subunit I
MHVVPSEEGDRELGEFILRAGRCLFCGFCAQVCPVDAIAMSREYELSVLERDGLIYTKTELATIGGQVQTWWDAGSAPGADTRHPEGGRYEKFRDVSVG